MVEIPNLDLNAVISMIVPWLNSLLKSVADAANQIGMSIYPQNPALALFAIAVIVAFLFKDKLSGGILFIIVAFLIFLILTNGIVL